MSLKIKRLIATQLILILASAIGATVFYLIASKRLNAIKETSSSYQIQIDSIWNEVEVLDENRKALKREAPKHFVWTTLYERNLYNQSFEDFKSEIVTEDKIRLIFLLCKNNNLFAGYELKTFRHDFFPVEDMRIKLIHLSRYDLIYGDYKDTWGYRWGLPSKMSNDWDSRWRKALLVNGEYSLKLAYERFVELDYPGSYQQFVKDLKILDTPDNDPLFNSSKYNQIVEEQDTLIQFGLRLENKKKKIGDYPSTSLLGVTISHPDEDAINVFFLLFILFNISLLFIWAYKTVFVANNSIVNVKTAGNHSDNQKTQAINRNRNNQDLLKESETNNKVYSEPDYFKKSRWGILIFCVIHFFFEAFMQTGALIGIALVVNYAISAWYVKRQLKKGIPNFSPLLYGMAVSGVVFVVRLVLGLIVFTIWIS